MEDVKVSNGADCQLEQKCDEKERFDKFMNVMVQRHVQLNLEVFQRMQDLREQDLDLRLFLKN
mgnify:CR=1 FL=1